MSLITPAMGGCSCGALRYRVDAQPLASYICHCHRCQKKSGSAFGLYLIFPADGIRIEQGEPERVLLPGSKGHSFLCTVCRAVLFSRRDGSPLVNLRGGTLDETSSIRPTAQLWTSSAQPWAVRDDIQSYAEQPADLGEMLKPAKS